MVFRTDDILQKDINWSHLHSLNFAQDRASFDSLILKLEVC